MTPFSSHKNETKASPKQEVVVFANLLRQLSRLSQREILSTTFPLRKRENGHVHDLERMKRIIPTRQVPYDQQFMGFCIIKPRLFGP